MKKLIFILAILIPILGYSQSGSNQLYGTFVTSDTITSDTLYGIRTSDVYFWNLQITCSGVTSQDTVWAKIMQSSDNGANYKNYAFMDSIQITATNLVQPFEDMEGNGGTHLGVMVNLGVLDTIVVTRVGYLFRPKNR